MARKKTVKTAIVPSKDTLPPVRRRRRRPALQAPPRPQAIEQVGGKALRKGRSKPARRPYEVLDRVLTSQDAALAQYLLALSTPTVPCMAPLLLGEFELITNTYSYVFNGIAYGSSANFGFVIACPDGWDESGNDGGPGSTFLSGTTQGYPVWYSPSGGAATTTPALGASSSANAAKQQLGQLDPGLTVTSRYRMTALIATVWSDAAVETAAGDICIAVCTSQQALEDRALNGVDFATVAAYPQEYVGHAEFPLSNWPADLERHTFAVPFGENCFVMQQPAVTGEALCASPFIALIFSGVASGQTIRYRIEYKYETTAPKTYMTSHDAIVNRAPAAKEALVPHFQALRPLQVVSAPAGSPGLTHAGLKAMKKADPLLHEKVTRPAPGSSFLGNLLTSAVKSAVSYVPYVGSFLSKLWHQDM